MQSTLVVIGGPTGIGKTRIAIDLAKYYKTCIISADSRQVFREMSIGTAAPTDEELKLAPHYFVKSRSIHEPYNASIYESEVMNFLKDQFDINSLIIMVGGSGLYIDAVCNGIDDLPSITKEIREKWTKIYEDKGIVFLQHKIKEIDPDYYTKVDVNNPKRLQKAAEIYEMTGKPYSTFLTQSKKERAFRIIKIALNTEREELYNRINHRVDKMIGAGLIEEARKLDEFRNLLPLKTVGYRELFDYFDDNLTIDEAITKIKDHSRAYARRQITWFKRDKGYVWFSPADIKGIKNLIDQQINK
jgi:tRNA dimethylallyltransferase